MGNSESKRKVGCSYTFQLLFVPDADKNASDCHRIDAAQLLEKLSAMIDVTEKILEVSIYTHPLNRWQLTDIDLFLFHAFVVFRTENHWWSIEKDSEGIIVQRTKEIRNVRDFYRGDMRVHNPFHYFLFFKCAKKAAGVGTVEDLIGVVEVENLLTDEYNYMSDNCKSFAARIYNRCSHGGCTVGLLGDLLHPEIIYT